MLDPLNQQPPSQFRGPTGGMYPQSPPPVQHVPPTSGAATSALVLAILGSMCLGPIGGLAAIILGVVALAEIRKSQGTQGGTAVAGIAIGLGALTTLGSVGAVVWAIVASATAPMTAPTSPPPIYLPPSPTLAPTPTTPTPRSPLAKEVASKDTTTVEFKVGALTVVDIGSDVSSLDAELRAQRSKAARSGEKMIVETTGYECRPCLGVAASLIDPRMQKALAGTRLVRIDVAEFGEELTSLGYPHEAIPGFFLVGVDLSPSDGMHGGEWDDDTAENISPVIGAFARGKLMKRREPWGGQKRGPGGLPPRGGGTEL
ncbi:MAG: DUF4190 domain-containing protein [Deltaproteobacteria bacterium]|nr:DUF4190 domain-containing protein [Deltaproteobacteria bacterium]